MEVIRYAHNDRVTCKCCNKSKMIRSDSGTIDRHCTLKNYTVNGFGYCNEGQEKQCTLCCNKKLPADTFPCILCAELKEKPYFGILIEE